MSESRSRLIENRRMWEQFLDSPAWNKLRAGMQAQADAMQQIVLFVPIKSMDVALEHENLKGQIAGRLAISAFIEAELNNIEADLKRLNQLGEQHEPIDGQPVAGFRTSP